jgi:GH15 family glucan-1,4-alpha-glucosidase
MAQYYIDNNQTDKAIKILDWAKNSTTSTGVMGEQVDPITKEIISPAPLTWSHAEYVSTLLDLITKDKK